MKILTLFLFLSLSLSGVCQKPNILKPLPKIQFAGFLQNTQTDTLKLLLNLKPEPLTLNVWKDPYLFKYRKKKDQLSEAMIQSNLSSVQDNTYDPWNMPVAKPGAGSWNMPVAVPDSTVRYYLKIAGEENGK